MPDYQADKEANAYLASCMADKDSAGGILGGISDGAEIILRTYVKPTPPSIFREQETVNQSGENIHIHIKGRHDPIIVPRAVVVVEAMAALTLADAMIGNMSSRISYLKNFYKP